MPSANTRPEVIVDKNGKKTTVHKKVDAQKQSERVSQVPAPKTPNVSEPVNGVIKIALNDEIFNEVYAEGKEVVGEFSIDGESIFPSDAQESISGYLERNKDDIRTYIQAEYGASAVDVYPESEEVVVEFKVPFSGDTEKVLDDFYATRAPTLHEHAFRSEKLSFEIEDFVNSSDETDFEPLAVRYAFDDGEN